MIFYILFAVVMIVLFAAMQGSLLGSVSKSRRADLEAVAGEFNLAFSNPSDVPRSLKSSTLMMLALEYVPFASYKRNELKGVINGHSVELFDKIRNSLLTKGPRLSTVYIVDGVQREFDSLIPMVASIDTIRQKLEQLKNS